MVERKQLQLGYAATALHCYITHLFQQAMPLFMIISEDGFNVTKGRSFAGMMNWLNARMSANQGCNTAKGVLFAAREWKYDSALSGTVAIPRKGRTLCGSSMMVSFCGARPSCNTAKGQNPLRRNSVIT